MNVKRYPFGTKEYKAQEMALRINAGQTAKVTNVKPFFRTAYTGEIVNK